MNPLAGLALTAVAASSFFVTEGPPSNSKVDAVAHGVLVESPGPSAVVQRGMYILRWKDSRLLAKGADPAVSERLDALVASKGPVVVRGTLESKVGEEPLLVISAIDADPQAPEASVRIEFDRGAKIRIQHADRVDIDKAVATLEFIVNEVKPFTTRADVIVHGECTYAEVDAFVQRIEALGVVVGGVRMRDLR